ncbi:MAG: EAL domain-containing protein [Desulfobulbaceae bacterium]|jgi:diguanylate cyclase (GGDEF)-like protein|nr:EAL domain-containing protein [Desulfobulbaceae bacterium]
MTLYRQLLFSCLFILSILCAGLWFSEFSRSRIFMEGQLASQTQDAATFLGLALTADKHGMDRATMEAMVGPLFDRGYYQSITIRDLGGETLLARSQPDDWARTPAWFRRLVALDAPPAEATILRGWQQVGVVTVVGQPGPTYAALWQSLQNTVLWFALALAGAAILGGLGLKHLLKPLRGIERQAVALCQRRFDIQDELPRTRELLRVVMAMNRAAGHIRLMFERQATMAEDLRLRLLQDNLTGVGNRLYLESQVAAKVENTRMPVAGAFFLAQIQDLQGVNQRGGYQSGDQLLQEAARIITESCHAWPAAAIARLNGGDFALLVPDADLDAAKGIAETIVEDLELESAALVGNAAIRVGGVVYDQAVPLGKLLAYADRALSEARSGDQVALSPMCQDDDAACCATGRLAWRDILRQVIETRAVVFLSQRVVAAYDRDQIVHYEILTRMRLPADASLDRQANILPLGMGVPTAERLGLMPDLDRLVIEELLARPFARFDPAELAINLSPVSLADPDFFAWLCERMREFNRRGLHIDFEFPEFRLRRHRGLLKKFAVEAKKLGHHIGLDHFGQGMMRLGYLSELLPDYVKIDRAFIESMREEQGGDFLINTLSTVAHSLDIKVIISGVENEEQWLRAAGFNLDGIQGYLIDAPKPIPTDANEA